MENVKAKIAELEAEELNDKQNEVHYTAKQKEEYQTLKQKAAAVTIGLKATVTALERQEKILQEKVREVSG